MRYTLYIAAATDDKRAAYAYTLTNYEGEVTSGKFITTGKRKLDEVYTSHLALQKALRQSAQQEGVIQLTVTLDQKMVNSIGFELAGIGKQVYPELCETTQRIMKRFNKCDLAGMGEEDDLQPYEASVCDDALDLLEHYRTVIGRWLLLKDTVLGSSKVIR